MHALARRRVNSHVLVGAAAAIVVACLIVPADASRDGEGQDASEPFSGVKEVIQQRLSLAASKLVQSSEAQAELTQSVATNIGQYKQNVQKIATTMGDVLKARQALTAAYHDDINRGEASRIGPLQVSIPELNRFSEDDELPSGSFSSDTDSESAGPPARRARPQHYVPQRHEETETVGEALDAALDRAGGDTPWSEGGAHTAPRIRVSSGSAADGEEVPSHANTDSGAPASVSDPLLLPENGTVDADGLEFGEELGASAPAASALVGLAESVDVTSTPAARERRYEEAIASQPSPQRIAAGNEQAAKTRQTHSQQASIPGPSSFISKEERGVSFDGNAWTAEKLPHDDPRVFESVEEYEERPLHKSSLVHLEEVAHREAARRQARSHQQQRSLRRTDLHSKRRLLQEESRKTNSIRRQRKVTSQGHPAKVHSWAALAARRNHHARHLDRYRQYRHRAPERFRRQPHMHPLGHESNSRLATHGHRHRQTTVDVLPRSFTYHRRFDEYSDA